MLGFLGYVRVGWCSCGVGGCALVLGGAKLGMPLCVGYLAVVDGGWGGGGGGEGRGLLRCGGGWD